MMVVIPGSSYEDHHTHADHHMRFWKRIASVIDFQKMYGWFGLNDHKRKVANGRTGGRKTENRVEFW